jgi:hypothetical protein
MNDEKGPENESANAAPNTSETIEVPEEKAPGKWEMPTPVFQQSSGYLPQGFEKRFQVPDPQADVPTDEPVAEIPTSNAQAQAAAPAPALEISESPNIQPQPDLTEDLTVDPAPGPVVGEKKKRSPVVRIALALLGILAMVVFAIVFLAVIYYLFFYHPSEPQIFN